MKYAAHFGTKGLPKAGEVLAVQAHLRSKLGRNYKIIDRV